MHVEKIMEAHPRAHRPVDARIVRCVEACYDCAQACSSCADASLAEETVKEMLLSIRLCLDCGDICVPTGAGLSRQTGADAAIARALVALCRDACRACAEECRRHAAHMAHCRICAEVCEDCAKACDEAVGAIG